MAIALILFHFGGLIVGTPNHYLMQIALYPETIGTSNLYTLVLAIFAAATAIGVIIGSLVSSKLEIILIASLCTATVTLIWDMVALYSSVKVTAGTFLATILIAPFMVLWLYTIVEWWRGRD